MAIRNTKRGGGWDYIIVGAGSAGCALAYELATRQPHQTILVLEAGRSDRSPFIRLQAGVFRAIATHDWGYRSEPDPTRNGLIEPWIRGKVLGGTSSINSTIFVRGAARDFDRWASGSGRSPLPGWSAGDVMPLFRELEASDQPGPLRGQTGPLHVSTVKQPHTMTEAFMTSVAAAGYPLNADYNGERQEGVGPAQLTQRKGWRCSAADAFLKPLLGRKNISLLVNSRAEKIETEKGRAVAVSFLHRGKRRHESADQVILCAGVINSPQLLMLSGIGEAQELERHGIKVAIELPGVGRNLRDHPLVVTTYRSRIETYNLTGGLRQKAGFLVQFLRTSEGPLSNIFESVAFLRTTSSEACPDVQLHFTPVAWSFTPDGKLVLPSYPAVSVFVNKSYSLSGGHIHLASGDPHDAPRIEVKLFENEADLDTLARGIILARRIMATEPIASLIEEELKPGPDIATVEMLKHYLRENGTIANHGIGTCRMGTDPDSVVGPDLRVHGTANIWVADASIMPEHISGNTSAACMMIGKKLGQQFAASAGREFGPSEPSQDRPRQLAGGLR
jgi:choline dehydrogenase